MAKVLVDTLSAEIAVVCTTASRRTRYKSWFRASVYMRFALLRRRVRISRTKPSITEDGGRARVVASDDDQLESQVAPIRTPVLGAMSIEVKDRVAAISFSSRPVTGPFSGLGLGIGTHASAF